MTKTVNSNGATRRRETLITVELGIDVLFMVDDLRARLQRISLNNRAVSRSAVVREAIICLHSKQLHSADNNRSEAAPATTKKEAPGSRAKAGKSARTRKAKGV